ncbi:MAG: DEAD/DEAH box helicase, partial [Pseudomonadota bacterium]
MKFSELDLDPKVLKAVEEAGYETPTPIQQQAIPFALAGRDVLGIAQTGTGKTASFTLPMITLLAKGRARARMPRSLVLAPTRELAAQVAENFEAYSKFSKLSMALLIGGTSFKDQDRLIDRGVDVLIATPGRLLDHFERGKLMLTGIEIMVVDEADRMLDMGFIPDIERIFKLTPFTRQTLFFSATMAPEITRITQEFLSNPERVEVARQATTAESITQTVCKHKPSRKDRADREKRDVLRRLIDAEGAALTNGIVFCNRKRDVDVVAKSLKKHGYDAAPIHGDLDQSLRTRTLEEFRGGAVRLLIASDVAARGLDIPLVSHVFNFDVPSHSEDYVHRIGRTGRAGRDGCAITLCLPHEEKYLEAIEALVKKKIEVRESPLAKAEDAAPPAVGDKPAEKARSSAPKSRATSSASRATSAPKPRTSAETPSPRASTPASGSDRRSRGSRDAVVGMGAHVPAFLMRDFDVAALLASTNAKQANDDGPEAPVDTGDVAEAPKKTRAPRSRKKATPAAAVPEQTALSEPVATASTPAEPSPGAVGEAAGKTPAADGASGAATAAKPVPAPDESAGAQAGADGASAPETDVADAPKQAQDTDAFTHGNAAQSGEKADEAHAASKADEPEAALKADEPELASKADQQAASNADQQAASNADQQAASKADQPQAALRADAADAASTPGEAKT